LVNFLIKELYSKLGTILEEGDDAFITKGPLMVRKYFSKKDFLKALKTNPAKNGYTRVKVIGENGKHVIRFMEWAPGFNLMPHEHHGRPCFELLVSGQTVVSDMLTTQVKDDLYKLKVIQTKIVNPGEFAVVDPRITQIHSVFSPVRSTSVHFYPSDNYSNFGYILNENDSYIRTEFKLKLD